MISVISAITILAICLIACFGFCVFYLAKERRRHIDEYHDSLEQKARGFDRDEAIEYCRTELSTNIIALIICLLIATFLGFLAYHLNFPAIAHAAHI